MMNGPGTDPWAEIRALYVATLPEKLAELQDLISHLRDGSLKETDGVALQRICAGVHKLHGSAGSYGFSAASAIAGEWEAWLTERTERIGASHKEMTADEFSRMQGYLQALRDSLPLS